MAALCVLSRADGAQLHLVKAGALGVLVSQIRHVHSRLRQQCALAVYQLTCTALRDAGSWPSSPSGVGVGASSVAVTAAAAASGIDESADAELFGLGRLKLLLDADVASALTVGSLFRADDNVTRDLCAATLFNLVALTRLCEPPPPPPPPPAEGDAADDGIVSVAPYEDGAEGAIVPAPRGAAARQSARAPSGDPSLALQLRRRLLDEGTLWAVVKLAQGFAETAAIAIVAMGRPPRLQRDIDLASPQDLHSRYVTTARLIRNMAIDPESADDAAKRHCIDMLHWFAQQSHSFFRSTIAAEGGLPAPRIHPATVPAIVSWIGESLVALSGHASVRQALAGRGIVAVIAELVAVAIVHLRVRRGGTQRGANADLSASVCLSILPACRASTWSPTLRAPLARCARGCV